MSFSTCPTCFNTIDWSWEEAFDKFGFCDGDGLVMTEHVANALRNSGYVVITVRWDCHNVVIEQISRDGKDLIPDTVNLGYDDPRDYLPKKIVKLLDATFTGDTEVQL